MKKTLVMFSLLCAASLFVTETLAEEQMQYQKKTLPDGTIESNYSSNGMTVKQFQYPDGSIVIDTIDASGNETITTKDKNGNIQVQTKKK